jgi:alpha/beta hydrolase family protein DUF900
MGPITRFLDTRALWSGGDVFGEVQSKQWTGGAGFSDQSMYVDLALPDLKTFIYGKDVLIATHGFNVSRADGIQTLATWSGLLTLAPNAVFLGLLWPGDSDSLHALSYPVEPKNAMDSGTMIGQYLDANFGSASSISLVSHSLGARVLLQAIRTMATRTVRRAILMAGAIPDDTLTDEFADVPAKIADISILASMEDDVLKWAFPLGNFVGEIVGKDHPWWQSALGRTGPATPPAHFDPPFQIPDGWNYGHGNYLGLTGPNPGTIAPPENVPSGGQEPWPGNNNSQPRSWSAAFVSTRFR